MALLTSQDQQTLSSWSFLADYQNHRVDLVDVARSVYRTVSVIYNASPQPVDCEDALTASLLRISLFAGILRKKRHASPSLHSVFARAMARYLLDNDWNDIVHP